jgi:hypothetical protein
MTEVFISPPDRLQERVQSSSPVVAGVVHAEPLDFVEDELSTSNRTARKLRDACTAYFDRKDFVYSVVESAGGDPDRCLIKAGIGGENGSYQLLVDVKEQQRVVIVYVLSSLKFPKPNRLRLCEYLTRANYLLVLGNFELDLDGTLLWRNADERLTRVCSFLSPTAHSLFFSIAFYRSVCFWFSFCPDGEVRYKCSTAVGPEGLSNEVFDRMMPAAMGTMDRYFTNMVKVGYGIMDPKEAVEEVEQSGSSSSPSSPLSMQQALIDALATAVSVDDSTSTTTTTTTACVCTPPNNGADDVFAQ